MEAFKKVANYLAPEAKKADDGRDLWPSRLAFIFASMGGAIGLGNLLRYPSVVFANSGLQWFIPYLIALFIIGIPVLLLEISIGQTYRGGTVIAFNKIDHRLRGLGLAVIMNGYFVVIYYVPIIAWIMRYFENSFKSPLPWTGRGEEFYLDDVIANTAPIPAVYDDDGGLVSYASYPDTGFVGPTVGWAAFVWVVVFLCMFKGVGLTGRVVYFTIGIPIVTVIILMGRSLSLDNAGEGVKLYFAEWHSSKLSNGDIWQAAAGQIFFSIGVGFGYFTSYASYNAKYSNAVQDSVVIACANSAFEVISAFSVFGIIGYLDLKPDASLGTFTVAFLTYPQAISEMPGANFWAILFFATIFLLGISSAFALLESIVTLTCDTDWARKIPRTLISTGWVIVSFLLSLLYCTKFGFYLLDAVDTYVNNCSLLFVVWCECILPNIMYRRDDAIHEVGLPAWGLYTFGYVAAQCIGVGIGHGVDASQGAIVGFAIYIVLTIAATLLAKQPTAATPGFWGKNAFLSKFWWMTLYSGNQLTRDLNVVVAQGKNWSIPFYWAPTLRYISAPILAIIFGFVYPKFHANRGDPIHIFAFATVHVIMALVFFIFILPSWLGFVIPGAMKDADKLQYATAPAVTLDDTAALNRTMEDAADMAVGVDANTADSGSEKK